METRVVARTEMKGQRREREGKYAELFSKLLDVKRNEALEIDTRDRKHGRNVRRAVTEIAAKEKQKIGRERSADGTKLWMWIETGTANR